MDKSLQYALTGALTMALIAGFRALAGRQKPSAQPDGSHRIGPSRVLIGGLSVVCLAISAAGFIGALFAPPDQVAAALLIGAMFALFGLPIATYLTRAYDIRWDDTSLTGPASYAMWPFGPRQATIRFVDIAKAGTDSWGSDFVTDTRGEKVRWNYIYAGHTALKAALAQARPDLFSQEAAISRDRSP